MGKKESELIPFLIEAGKLKTYGSCLDYNENKGAFKIHLPRKKKTTCADCFQMLQGWISHKGRNVQDAQYSRDKHAILIALNKSNYADIMLKEGDYCWYKVLSSKESEEKRLRKSKKQNPISLPSPGSEGYGTNSSECSRSADQDSCESGCFNNVTNNLSHNQNEGEIQQQGGPNSILSQPSTSEGYDSSNESPLSADSPFEESQSPFSANNFSGVESGIESSMPSDDLNSTTNGNFYEIYHNPNGVDSEILFSGPETIQEYETNVQAEDDNQNSTSEHIFGNVLNCQQFEISGNGREIHDTSGEVIQDWLTDDITDVCWNSILEELFNTHCLRNENNAGTDERFPRVMYYKLIYEISLGETVLLILKEMDEVRRDTESNMLHLNWFSEEPNVYKLYEITPNIYGYFEMNVLKSIRSTQISEIKRAEGHLLYFLKPLQTISPRIYSTNSDGLN